jgi:sugar/nucleoside kinase (ribokinase family)
MEFGIPLPRAGPFDAVAFGLNAVDHLIVVPCYPEFNSKTRLLSHRSATGGESATAMVALARLGLATRYIGTVGNDAQGRLQVESLQREGVDCSMVVSVNGAQTQTAFIIIDERSGERTIVWDRDKRLAFAPEQVDRDAVTSGSVLLVNGPDIEAMIAAAGYAREAGVPVVIDIETVLPGTDRLLPMIDFVISSSSFPGQFTGETDLRSGLKAIASASRAKLVAVTLGADGVLALCRGEFIHAPGFKVDCKDTTGAGDAFRGGFIYGLLKGLSVDETLRFANAVAALKCRELGAQTALPRLEEVNQLLRGS